MKYTVLCFHKYNICNLKSISDFTIDGCSTRLSSENGEVTVIEPMAGNIPPTTHSSYGTTSENIESSKTNDDLKTASQLYIGRTWGYGGWGYGRPYAGYGGGWRYGRPGWYRRW